MKSISYLFFSLTIVLGAGCKSTTKISANTPERTFYQLEIYTFENEQQLTVTEEYLRTALLPALHRLNINAVGVFKQRPEKADSVKKLFVLTPFSSLDQFRVLEDRLLQDEQYLKAAGTYLNIPHDEPPYQRIQSILLRAFKGMPHLKTPEFETPGSKRVYELRSYESPTEAYFRNKVEMFNEGGEIKIFEQLGFNAVFYGEVIAGSKMPNLMYMTTFPDMKSRRAHWKAFSKAPEWQELKANSSYKNNVSHIDVMFLYPTGYSDY